MITTEKSPRQFVTANSLSSGGENGGPYLERFTV